MMSEKVIFFSLLYFIFFNVTINAQVEVDFDFERGFYANPFSVTLTSPEPGVTIKYTTDGKTPSQTVGSSYTGPININTTTVLKAIA